MDGRKARIKRKLEGEKLVGEQRDIKTNALHVIGIKFVNEEDKMIEVYRQSLIMVFYS